MTKLYHRDVFMPPGCLTHLIDRQWNLAYTRHALTEGVSERLTHAPRSVRFIESEVIEIERGHINWRGQDVGLFITSKLVVRVPYDDRRDLVLTLRHFDDGAATVVTMWCNDKGDAHKTLDTSKYATK